MKKKFSIMDLFEDNKFLRIFSVVFAVLCWMAVVMTTSSVTTREIRGVPVSIDSRSETLAELGLNIIEGTDAVVDITVRGSRTVVGNLSADDFQVSANITGVTEPNTYNLPLVLENQSALEGVELEGFNPSTVRVRFDRLATKTFEIEDNIKGISTEDGYLWEPVRLSPYRVTVTGPYADLEKIEKAVVELELTEPLTRNFVSEEPILLLNAQGDVIDIEGGHLTVDNSEAQVMIRVLKLKTLPLLVDFTHVPSSFPLDELLLYMEMSDDEIVLAGPVDIMDNYQEILLGTIDIKTLSPTNRQFIFEVELPSTQFSNINNISTVMVEFDTEDWDMARFNADEESFRIINAPPGYEVNVLTTNLTNIAIVGKKNALQSITSEDIVVVVDLSDKEVLLGQYTYPVKVSVPTKGMAWAIYDYTVIIQVTETVSAQP